MGSAINSVKEYAIVAFTLLGILFGMMIMTFIFGQLGNSSADTIDDETLTVVNRSGVFINHTLYAIPEASYSDFNGGFKVIAAVNATDGLIILPANYTVTASAGTIQNATAKTYNTVNMTYSYLSKTDAKLKTEEAQNNSLQGIVSYTDNSSTQFNTVSIAIILVLLIGVFLLFWKIFVKDKKSKKSNFGGNFG